ncbi:hypothetical protein A7M48_23170 [Acinetobacter baumannii]|nr:hypothetical protein A7M48_23170 [Acinetobacter baumannii]
MKGKQIGLTLEHTDHMNENHAADALHRWNITLDVLASTKSNWFKLTGQVQRNSKDDEDDWKVSDCLWLGTNLFNQRYVSPVSLSVRL